MINNTLPSNGKNPNIFKAVGAVLPQTKRKIDIDISDIDVAILVTQNPDRNIPHSSAEIHGKLNMSETTACFDISLGCSGYVYALSVIQSFMQSNNFKEGLLFTCDPYSKIMDKNDRNTELLFGDAASVTLLSENPKYTSGKFLFGTIGKGRENLICNDKLFMNGRGIYEFAAKYVPNDFKKSLKINGLSPDDIDKVIFHQGSKHIIPIYALEI